MAHIVVSHSGFRAHFDVAENVVNEWISWAMRYGFGISVEVETESYQQYLRDFPLNDPRD